MKRLVNHLVRQSFVSERERKLLHFWSTLD